MVQRGQAKAGGVMTLFPVVIGSNGEVVDNYAHQDAVCLDEFYGWLQWDVLLRLADRYPLLVETKGGQIQFSSKKLIFTSNTEPTKWYKEVYFESFCEESFKMDLHANFRGTTRVYSL